MDLKTATKTDLISYAVEHGLTKNKTTARIYSVDTLRGMCESHRHSLPTLEEMEADHEPAEAWVEDQTVTTLPETLSPPPMSKVEIIETRIAFLQGKPIPTGTPFARKRRSEINHEIRRLGRRLNEAQKEAQASA